MSDLQDVIHINAKLAYEQGVKNERERIIRLLTNIETKLDAMRPESYKKVSDMADLRIRTIRTMIALIEREAE